MDLPGYGYASVSRVLKQDWSITMKHYLRTREPLKLVLFLQDIRREPDKNDLEMFDIIMEKELPMILLFTKIDKISSNERHKNKNNIIDILGLSTCMSVLYSAHDNIGRPELAKFINLAFS